MANEARVTSSLNVTKGTTRINTKPTSFTADVDASNIAPTPGLVVATLAGTDVDLSALTTPGLCTIQNVDGTNYVTGGIWDPEGNTFYPLFELLPGEKYVLRLARDIEEEFGT